MGEAPLRQSSEKEFVLPCRQPALIGNANPFPQDAIRRNDCFGCCMIKEKVQSVPKQSAPP